MNKTELISRIAEETELTKVTVEKVLNKFFTVVPEALAEGKEDGVKVQIANFGTWSASYTEGRTGINPKNPEETIEIPASYRVYFSAGKGFKDIVNDRVEKKEVAQKTATKKVAKKIVKKVVKKK